ncbi:MAG: MotA/TolQ/ExbB proton channel family protein [Pseudobacteriovorax sp.]|nr:MotA/TolQ/ExbB proton channel family protein [Pseudobacteriovorax sp.]
MSLSTLLGFIFGLLIFGIAISNSLSNFMSLINLPSILIVFGGTLTTTLVCFPLSKVFLLLRVFMRRILRGSKHDYASLVVDIVALAEARRVSPKKFEKAIEDVKHPFLKEAAQILFWLKADISEEEMRSLLETRANTQFKEYMSEAKIFKTISKFPPAFGLMGTTLGLIGILQSMNGDENARALIGPAMAVALLTTFYGLFISNFILVPISENLVKQCEEDRKVRSMIVEGIMLLQAEKPPRFVGEHIKSYLLPSQREKLNEGA